MPDFAANLLKLIFIGLIYLFVWQVARAIAAHLAGSPARNQRTASGELVVVKSDTSPGLHITVRSPLVLGRSPEADILLDDPYASDFHLRLGLTDGQVVVSDLGSTNGTYVNGRRVVTPLTLRRGDAVQVGKTVMEVR